MVGLKTIRFTGGNVDIKESNGIRILCIEDEHFISELYARALRKAGYDVTTLVSGDDGLRAAQNDNYDIIMLDLMIPGMTGFEVLRELSKHEPKLKAKIIITTNLDQDETSKDEIEKMADGYLIKAEFTPRQLVTIIDDLVSGKSISESTIE